VGEPAVKGNRAAARAPPPSEPVLRAIAPLGSKAVACRRKPFISGGGEHALAGLAKVSRNQQDPDVAKSASMRRREAPVFSRPGECFCGEVISAGFRHANKKRCAHTSQLAECPDNEAQSGAAHLLQMFRSMSTWWLILKVVMSLTTEMGHMMSMTRLWMRISKRSQVLVPSPQGDFLQVMRRILVGILTGPRVS
jgi:hypothetical protein